MVKFLLFQFYKQLSKQEVFFKLSAEKKRQILAKGLLGKRILFEVFLMKYTLGSKLFNLVGFCR
jgi:hypothetical protein